MSSVLIGHGKGFERMDEEAWKQAVVGAIAHMPTRLEFMTPAHHRVRNAAVRGLPANAGQPLSMRQVAAAAGVSEELTREIAAELERHLFFVVRKDDDHISWAFPVTSDRTPHEVILGTGERIYGA